ncbi:MAG: hypothetical protein IH798_03450, partial [Gemmatimonadetes bacterium]|nr:hypothetical protein [Gemmatimonadota bacterium]
MFRLGQVIVDIITGEDENPPARRVLAGLVLARVSPREAAAVNPVGAVEPGVVEETHGGEEVLADAVVRAALPGEVSGDGADL